MKQIALNLILFCLPLLNFAQECGALMQPISLEQRVIEASQIIEGTVVSSESYWDTNRHNIYTVHTIKTYKSFKGSRENTIMVVTLGGQVDGTIQITSSSPNLSKGTTGIFFVKEFRKQINIKGKLHELVAAAQGVVKYNRFTGKASDVFSKYTSIENELYSKIQQTTGYNTQIIQEFSLYNENNAAILANPIVYSFSPLTATAGTQTTLTITGNNFGASMGSVGFSNANDGGASFTTALDSQILSWSNTEIQVEIPYLAGTGSIVVTNTDNSSTTTSVPLTISYSHLNGTSGTVDYPSTLQDDNGSGGFTFDYHTDFDTSSAKTYFEDAFELWNCESGINFIFGSTTNTDESIEDGINIVRFDNGSELASGVLGQVTTRYVGSCGTTGRAIANEIDITWDDSTNWYYGSGDASASQYDFKTVALHELGHAHQLGHVIDTDLIMHYSLGAGENKYSLGTDDKDAAVYTMGVFAQSPGCGITAMSSKTLCCEDVTISAQPANLSLAEGDSGQFSVTASGYTSALWFSSTDGNSWNVLSDGTDYSGTTTTTLTINSANPSDSGKFFRVYIENECIEFVNSNSATLTVISYTSIPDANFEDALEALGYDDISGDGQVPTDNINTITSLNVDNANISDLTGIEDFVALETLDADNNSLTTIDVTNLTNLRQLYLQYNSLASLDITNNSNLETLAFRNNSVTSIDLSNNVNLLSLAFQYNSITAIDLSNNILLYHIACRDNGLTALDFTNNPDMINIYAQNNSISVIDLSGNPDLAIVAFPNNAIVEFNIKNGNNTNITTFNTNGNSNLECILVDDADYSSTNWTQIDGTASFSDTSYCKYTAIPDVNFEAALETLGYDDISADGQVPTALIEVITNLDISGNSITDLTGIEDFTTLEELTITNNSLTSLDFSNNLALEGIFAGNNNISSIDLSNNIQLTRLWLQDNNLSTIDISNNPLLFAFSVGGNSLITIADISNNTALESLYLNDTAITTLDLSNHTQLTTLGLSNTNLNFLNLQNGNNTNLTTLFLTGNPNLDCIIVDDADYSNTNWSGNIDSGTSFTETGYCEYTAIPDANFEAALAAQNYDDISGDGQVPTALIEGVTNLSVDNEGITDLTGIEDFTALQKLNASTNNLTSVDLTNNANLEELNISDNANLTSLDVSSCVLLERVKAEDNAFSTLDLSANTQLDALFVTDNDALTEIDLSTNSLLRVLTLDNLDNIASVDVSQNATIDSLQVKNNVILSEFNIKNGANTDIISFQGNNNSSLTCILVDDADYSNTNWLGNIDSGTSFTETGYCKYTDIPDANFETALEALIIDDVSGDGQVPTAEIEILTSLDVRSLNISDLTGIEDFVALEQLYCSNNNLTALNVSNLTNLQKLWAFNNYLTTIDLTNNLAIGDLRIEQNELASIDLSNQTNLVFLQIDRNELTALDVSNSPAITRFRAYGNNISTIDLSNNSLLREVRVYGNDLLSLNVQNGNNTNIINFEAYGNELLDCILVDDASYSTTNWTSIDSQTTFNETACAIAYTTIIDANFEAALEALINDDISDDGKVPTSEIETLTSLDVSSLNIIDLTGIEDFVALIDLDAEQNNLTALDLSNNTLLETVDLDSNDLATLTLPTNGSLVTFICNNNPNLTTLDFSGNTTLQTVQSINNGLTTVNLSGLTALTSLSLNNNSLSAVDISYSTNLETLTLSGNALTSMDLSNNTNLTYLNTESNNLSSLDISNNTALEYLFFSNNNIASIDISNHTALLWLYTGGNLLTNIDVSNNTLLQKLWVNDNQLTSIDIASNTALVEFVCYNNAITTLDASTNVVLEWFLVNDNALTSVNLQNGNNTNISNFTSYNNPDLTCVLVDDASYSTTNWTLVDNTTSFNETACSIMYTVAIDVFLQGAALNPNTGEENLMRDDLRIADYIPTTSPHTDGLTCDATVFDTTGDNAIVDWVFIELRDATDNTIVVASQSALLQRDGDVVDVDGVSDITFSLDNDTYYVVVKHRNHLGVMTNTVVTLSSNAVNNINFKDATNEITYGTDAQTTFGMPDGVIAMWAGDANEDGQLNYLGAASDVPSIRSQVFNDSDNSIFGGPPVSTYQSTGYYSTDVDMNGFTVYAGADSDVLYIRNNIFNNASNSVFGGPPVSTFIFTEQLP